MAGKTREAKVSASAAEHGWRLAKVGRRFRLVNAETGTVVADDWVSGDGLTLDLIEQALN